MWKFWLHKQFSITQTYRNQWAKRPPLSKCLSRLVSTMNGGRLSGPTLQKFSSKPHTCSEHYGKVECGRENETCHSSLGVTSESWLALYFLELYNIKRYRWLPELLRKANFPRIEARDDCSEGLDGDDEDINFTEWSEHSIVVGTTPT